MELVLVSVFLLSFINPSMTYCNIPPAFWCDSVDVSKQCEVFHQCQKLHSFKGKEAPPVDFTLYYESLCPYCKTFFTKNLGPAYKKLSGIMNLTLVPYGNAEETKAGNKWTFQCQHGPSECTGNAIETCTINIVKNITEYFPFLLCMEALPSDLDPTLGAEHCAKQNPVPISEILNCSTSDEGNKMEHEMAVKTDALEPPLAYVPYVALNDIHTDAIQKEAMTDLVTLICATYTGQPKPPACQNA